MRHASNALEKDKDYGTADWGRICRETDAQHSRTWRENVPFYVLLSGKMEILQPGAPQVPFFGTWVLGCSDLFSN
jgi:hypothetical protein